MKIMKKVCLVLALAIALSSMSLSALAGSCLGDLQVINCDSWVTLRSSPSTKASTVCRVPLGAIVTGYYYNTEFTECYYNGCWGYILSSYLGPAPSYCVGYSYGDYMGQAMVVNCDSWVTLRSAPSTKASTVVRVPKGAYVDAFYYNTEFAECYIDGFQGYILTSYLSIPTVAPNYLGWKVIANCNEFVTLRSAPSTSASAVTRVPKGQMVEAYYYNGTFAYCIYNGLHGYILSQYLR